MNSFELEVNERIDVIFKDKVYKSLIIDVSEDYDSIKINLPICEGESLLKDTGDELDINIYSKNGRCYNFNSEIISKGKDGSISYYELSSPYNIRRIQRRNFFRVDIINDTKYKNITHIDDEEEIESMPFNNALMIDLSAGGMRLKSKEPINKGDILLIKIEVKSLQMLLKGEVVRVEADEELNKVCGIKFLDITETQIDKIIEELFEIMRKQKELL
ncbi:MAG: pilus assembly protein PilZ [Clostridium butyricum]|nr:pilus assembly protein PilZ [Clostridium butyricum]